MLKFTLKTPNLPTRTAEHWPRPLEFRPERFLDPEEAKLRHPLAHMP